MTLTFIKTKPKAPTTVICCHCGTEIPTVSPQHLRQILQAVRVNKNGSWCAWCREAEEQRRDTVQ